MDLHQVVISIESLRNALDTTLSLLPSLKTQLDGPFAEVFWGQMSGFSVHWNMVSAPLRWLIELYHLEPNLEVQDAQEYRRRIPQIVSLPERCERFSSALGRLAGLLRLVDCSSHGGSKGENPSRCQASVKEELIRELKRQLESYDALLSQRLDVIRL